MELITRPEFVIAALVLVLGAAAAWYIATGSGRRGAQDFTSSPRTQSPPGGVASPEPGASPGPVASPAIQINSYGTQPAPATGQTAGTRASVSSAEPGRSGREMSSVRPDRPATTFADVAGLDEAIAELREVRDYLASPERFRALGAELPNGILLYGPPGNGKTLLARALAGEAHVPFYFVSAASFVEQYVGLGAARIRQLFEEAKKHPPAIVFIDELDAVGRRRDGAQGGSGAREFDHTLNQLLVELDGSASSHGVCLLGATNRPELLDPALVRPGRFDRRIPIDPPDLEGRDAILRLHASRRPFADSIDWRDVAAQTAGLSAAELTNLLNEASLLAAREFQAGIGRQHVEEALSRVLTGPRQSRVMDAAEKRRVAVHEAGHVVLTLLLHGIEQPRRVSIVGRGSALGRSTWSMAGDQRVVTERELMGRLMVLMAGRAAELRVFGEPSTRAEDDLEEAAKLARRMIHRYGMTGGAANDPHDRLALAGDELFSGLGTGEVLRRAEQGALTLIERHQAGLNQIADALIEHETLALNEIAAIAGISSRQGLDPMQVAA